MPINLDSLDAREIRKLAILDDEVVEEIVRNQLRGLQDSIDDTELLSAWKKVVDKAKQVLDKEFPDLVEPIEIKKAIFALILKEFPYQGNL